MHTQAHENFARGMRWLGLGVGIGAAVAGLTLIGKKRDRTVTIKTSVTIRREPAEIYRFWRELSNLPRFMRHLECVVETPGQHTSWVAKGPLGVPLEWEADIVTDRAGDRIAWCSRDDATLPNHGAVLFRRAAGNRGTEVHLTLGFDPPGGALATKLMRLFHGLPEQQLNGDLRRLKQILETGEVVRSDASIHRGTHAARPADGADGTVQS